MSDDYIKRIRDSSYSRFTHLQNKLVEANTLVEGKACVFATGSFGRMEAGPKSDLDLFIVVDTMVIKKDDKPETINQLDGIGEITLKYLLIKAVQDCGIESFDGGGKYLQTHDIADFTNKLGTRDDDYCNTLTGRLLLILESRLLLGQSVYDKLLDNVIDAYFKDFENNSENFVPAFLVNDILRMWRTFAVNYENFRKKGGVKYKIKNLKLKYSRMITCYSAIIYLLSEHLITGTITPEDVRKMVGLTPTERIERVSAREFADSATGEKFRSLMAGVVSDYSSFLSFTHEPDYEAALSGENDFRLWRDRSHQFGRSFAEALTLLGRSSDPLDGLYRIILI